MLMVNVYHGLVDFGLLALAAALLAYLIGGLGVLTGMLPPERFAQWWALGNAGLLVTLTAFLGALATRPK